MTARQSFAVDARWRRCRDDNDARACANVTSADDCGRREVATSGWSNVSRRGPPAETTRWCLSTYRGNSDSINQSVNQYFQFATRARDWLERKQSVLSSGEDRRDDCYTNEQEAQLMLTTGSTRLAVSRGQQTWYHSTCYI